MVYQYIPLIRRCISVHSHNSIIINVPIVMCIHLVDYIPEYGIYTDIPPICSKYLF